MDLSVEELQALLKLKQTHGSEKCQFKPTRSNQVACDEKPSVSYGPLSYCKKHCRTVQALNAKKEYEDSLSSKVTPREPESSQELPQEKSQEPPKESSQKDEKPESPDKLALGGASKMKEIKNPPKVTSKTLKPNKWGRYEETKTHILFDPDSKSAYGVQDRIKGRVLPLSEYHIRLCKKYGWTYHVLDDSDTSEVPDSKPKSVKSNEHAKETTKSSPVETEESKSQDDEEDEDSKEFDEEEDEENDEDDDEEDDDEESEAEDSKEFIEEEDEDSKEFDEEENKNGDEEENDENKDGDDEGQNEDSKEFDEEEEEDISSHESQYESSE
jgi:hypothetical protein